VVVVVGLLAALFLGVVTSADAAPPTVYVALGDSYTAGPFINLDFSGTVPPGCAQSKFSYPYLVASSIGADVFRDPSCSSATSANFTSPQAVSGGVNPPQYDALLPDATVVTIGIGGNDVGLVSLATNCINLAPVPLAAAPLGESCASRYTAGGVDQYSDKIAAFAPVFSDMLEEVHRRAPAAQVFVVGYPSVLPEGPGCWPYVPLLAPDVAYVRAKVMELNALEAQLAAAHGATFVDTWTSSIGHDACQAVDQAWVDGIIPFPPAYPMHPNAPGMSNTGRVVAGAISSGG